MPEAGAALEAEREDEERRNAEHREKVFRTWMSMQGVNRRMKEDENKKVIHAFKGFNKDMTCRGFQYEEGKEFHTDKAKCCDEGFHACEYPLDCFSYYNPAESVFHEVELSGETDRKSDDTKICATNIKIGARLSIAGIVKAAIDFTMSKVNKKAKSDERHGFSSATGDRGASSATGDYGASSATGNYGASSATGDGGVAVSTGYNGSSSVSSDTGIAVAWGIKSKVKGRIGSYLVLSDWKNNGKLELVGAKMVRVDGEKIKDDTYYRLIDGKLVEAD